MMDGKHNMPSPFEKLAEDSRIGEQIVIEKLAVGHKTSTKFSMENMREWMNRSKQTKNSSICALLIGDPKVGKSGVVLDCRTEQDKIDGKKIIVFELNSDNGCSVNKDIFHPNDENIIILNPREYSQDKDGSWNPDYIATMNRIKSAVQIIKEDVNSGVNIKAICLDGLDIFLSEICESQVRLEEHVDAAGGLSMRFYKNRNKFYYDVLNMIFDIDCDKYMITHYAPRTRDDKTGQYNDKRTISKINENLVFACQKSTTDKVHQVIEFTDKTRIVNGKRQVKIVATIVSDRRSLDSYMKEIVIAETGTDGKVKWDGQAILERD